MTTLRPFVADDLFKFNHINLDPLTETYSVQFYMVCWLRLLLHGNSDIYLILLVKTSNILLHGLVFVDHTKTRTEE